jgi:hypothetical protein
MSLTWEGVMTEQEELSVEYDQMWRDERRRFNFRFLGAMLLGAGFWVFFVLVMYAFWYEASN